MKSLEETEEMRQLLFACSAVLAMTVACQAAPVDGESAIFHDTLLEHMVGHWKLEGTLLGKHAVHTIDAAWILNHQFLQIHEVGALEPKSGKPGYEALPTIGYDNMSERYVAHWLDVFGGRFSETLGYGRRDGNAIHFVFEYPQGPFHTDFIWDPAHAQWRWHMTQKNESGKWTPFADMVMSRM